MAPSRRKGGGRVSAAAAAAAACRKWKVGDLVLAKVKGFPAWPATVSAPEKWGYSGGWKKVLVHFFGTQQIAFCNPADVEEFTEEKKETLLVRRHGKGADYVRAVHEIIESYEESKKQEPVVDINYLDEATVPTAGNRESDFSSNDQIEAPSATRSSRVKKSKSTGEKNESSLPVADAADATRADTGDMDTSSEDPTDSSLFMRKPRASILSSQNKGGDVQPQISSSLKRDSSSCRSRSSSRVYTSRFQKSSLPLSNGNKSVEDTAAKISQNGLVRRSKRIRKSPDVSEGHATGSPAFLSNGSNEENGSEIVMVDSDTFSVTEGSTVETGSKSLQPESIAECGERDVELSQALDFQTKAIVLKKKRKPNRKRVTNDAPESIGGLTKAGADIELHKAGQVSPISHENSHEKYSKEDGDEHLPLVKRARVRMARPSSVGEELDTAIQSEAKLLEASNSFSSGVSTQSQDHGPEKNSFVVNEVTENPSLPNEGPQSSAQQPQLWDVKKKQQFGCSVDGEAALPPSKRLHRALEAMSANAAEDGRTEEPSSSTKLLTNGCCLSSIPDSPHISSESRVSNGLGVQNVDILSNNASQGGTCGISDICASAEPKEIVKSSIEGTIFNGPVRSSSSPKHELCKDIHVDAGDHLDSKGITLSSSGTQTCEAVVVAQSSKPLSPDPVEEQTCLGCNQDSLAQMLRVKDECKNENHASEFRNHNSAKPLDELGPSDHSGMSSDPVSTSVDHKCSPQTGTNLLLCSAEGNCSGSTQLWKLSLHADDQVDGMCEVVKEIKAAQKESNAILTPTSLKVMDVVAEGPPNLEHINSVSDDHLGDKDVSGIGPFSTPTDGVDSLALVSPPNTSICNTSTSDNDNILENNGCCSPDVHLHHAKSKNMGKWSSKAEAAAILASFQAVIGTLKRTKESIGRATRIAIDCAKFGIAAKVVEILVRDLQSESSLRRRVDLFFLVDSITQCSRGLRGDVGGIYPSAIQAVLPRLILAAAPPGSDAQENRRQCLKVLKLWLERRILPDSIVRHHIRALESLNGSSSSGAYSRRPLRTERAFDDPIRQMEGMLVDEYGSNSSFQLPGFHMPPMLKDEGDESDSDGGSFEAVTPEHDSKTPEEGKGIPISAAVGNHRHILEDVDGELEMEDVAPACEALSTSTSNTSQLICPQLEQHFPPTPTFTPHVPKDATPSFPPLPTSPPPAAPPPPPPPALPPMPPRPPMPASISESDAKLYNVRENLHQFVAQQPVVPGVNSMNSDAALYQAPEYRDVNMPTQIPDFSSNTGCHQPVVPGNGVQQMDGATFYNKAYHLPPPQPAPSNQFSYVQADQQVQSLPPPPLPPPPPYPNRAHFVQSTDGGSFSSDHDRMELAPHEHRESWRFPGPSFSSTHYPDPARGSYHVASYGGPTCEPPLPNHSWGFPPQSMNHGEFMAHGPQSRGPIPVATRAPNFWQPR